ncbi:MAG: thioredoxin fold domain-containing protein [Sedimentisphaerales bacterium]|nr:thioredoxin fold domain-containing protein [Sedimentisphaerales bacterium]
MQKALIIQIGMGLLVGGAVGALLGYFGKCSTGTCPLTANPYRGAFVGALMGGVLAFSSTSAGTRAEPSAAGQVALHIDSVADFERDVLDATVPVLVDFYSNSCPPCRALAPTIEELAEEYEGRAVVCKVNVEKVGELARRYGIQGIPTVVFFNQGQETRRLVGLRPKSAYTSVLNQLVG